MAIFAVTFRLENDADYRDRWTSLVQTIRAQADGKTTWEEPTSFFILESRQSADQLASAIYLGSKMHSNKDVLLVIDLTTKDQAVRGEAKYPAILTYLMGRR